MNNSYTIYNPSFLKKYLRLFLIIFGMGVTGMSFLTSCVDDELTIDEDKNGNTGSDLAGDVLAFTIQFDKDITSRAMIQTNFDESMENYIDTQNKFRILFFDKDGYFMFGAIDRTVTPMGDNNYYVRIPINYIVDRLGNAFDADEIKRKLRTEKFKIAVLANWPNNGVIHPSDYDDSDEGEDRPIADATVIKGEPNWGWAESVLNPSNSGTNNNKKHLFDLHHLVVDGNYNNNASSSRPTRLEVYDFVMGGNVSGGQGTMGVKTDWVRMRDITETEGWKASYNVEGSFSDQPSAQTWIKTNWTPNLSVNNKQQIYRHYNNLWKLWDFNASYSCTPNNQDKNVEKGGILSGNYSAYNNSWGKEWWFRNGQDIKDWLNKYSAGNIFRPTTYLPDFDFSSSLTTTNEDEAFFRFVSGGKSSAERVSDSNGTGVLINQATVDATSKEPKDNYFTFKAHASGTLLLKMASATNNSETTITVRRGKATDDEGDSSWKITSSSSKSDIKTQNINLTGKSQDITIYCSSSTSAKIYSIEFVRDKYLYDTDREGMLPSEDYPIPMYGVQEFEAAADWAEGTTKDLSASTTNSETGVTSTGKSISLVRSLAKVILKLPQEATHVYLRSANRTARCEPIDVETPTNTLWKDHSKSGGCEWFKIIDYGFGYLTTVTNGQSDSNDKKYIGDYTNWLSWFYGAWRYNADGTDKDHQWDFNSHNLYYPDGNGETVPKVNSYLSDISDKSKFPRLFYPDINRSDYAAFRYLGQTTDGLHTYILYVPEKSIDDPNNVGKRAAQPKVAHIEFRLKGENENSLDDNDCHRIYFTNYGGSSDIYGEVNTDIIKIPAHQFDYYEKNELVTGTDSSGKTETSKNHGFLSKHWPIMRNHVYEFTVRGDESLRQNIQVKVADWGYQPVDVVW